MNILIGLVGMAAGIAIIKYRETIGDLFGNADWMKYVGGNYILTIIVGIIIFFFSFAKLTGTTDVFLAPLKLLFPFFGPAPAAGF